MNVWKQILMILTMTMLSAALSSTVKRIELSPQDPLALTSHSLKALKSHNIIILDVRSLRKYQEAHIKAALHFDSTDWEKNFAELMDKYTGEEVIITYCGSGCGSSKSIVKRLRESGIKSVFYIHNGFEALQNSGLEIVGTGL